MPDLGSVTIGGHPVAFDFQCKLRDFLRDRLPPLDTLFARWQPKPTAHAATLDNFEIIESPYPPLPPLEIGELQWPSGASRYARALYVVDNETMTALATAVWGISGDELQDNLLYKIPTDWGTYANFIELMINGEETFTAQMLPLPPYRIPGDGAALWLLPLVDKRYLWRQFTLGAEFPPTFAALFADAADTFSGPIYGSYVGNHGVPDWLTIKEGASWPGLLDCAALSVGRRIVVEPLTGMVRLISGSDSEARREATTGKVTIIAGGPGTRGYAPAAVDVICRRQNEFSLLCDDVITKSASVIGGIGYAHTVHSAWVVDYRMDNPLAGTYSEINAVATSAYVSQVGDDIEEWLASGGQYAFAGAIAYIPNGFDDYLGIKTAEVAHEEYWFGSTVHELPSVFLPNMLLNQWQILVNAPPIEEMVVTEAVTALVPGKAKLYGDDDYAVSLSANASFAIDEIVTAYYRCGLGWQAISGGGGGGTTEFYLFTLTADMAATEGSTAAGTISGIGAVTITNTGKFRPYSGATGYCVKLADGSYRIIHVNQPGDLLVTLDRLNTSSGSGLYTYGAHPDETDAKIKLSSPAPISLQPYPFSFQHSSLSVDVPNPFHFYGNYLDQALVRWSVDDEAYYLAAIYSAKQTMLWAEVKTNRPNGNGQVYTCDPLQPASNGEMPSTGFSVTDLHDVAINAKVGHKCLVAWNNENPGAGYRVVTSQHRATSALVKVKTPGFSGTPSTFTCTAASGNGMNGLDIPAGDVTVVNLFGWDSGATNEDITIEWDNPNGRWIPKQKDCTP